MKKLIGILLILVSIQTSFAQQLNDSLGLIANVSTTNTVLLKWLPSSYALWMNGVNKGYTIERTEVKVAQGKWVVVGKESLTPEPIKAWSSERITAEAKTNPDLNNAKVLVAARIMNDNQTPAPSSLSGVADLQTQKNYLHVMSLLANLLKNKSSEAMGLFFEDKTALPGKIYLYEVILNDTKKVKAEVIVNMNTPATLPKILGFDYQLGNKAVELYWLQPKHSGYFAYDIYRSASKSGTYEKVNNQPYIGEMGIRLDENRVKYIDSFPEMNKTFYYKIKAINGFEQTSPFSDVLTVKAITPLTAAPSITKSFSPDNSAVELEWQVAEADKESIVSFSVWTGRSPTGAMTKVNEQPLSSKIYTYKDTRLGKRPFNYYKVCAYGFTGDSLCSLVKEAFLVDSVAPAPPITVYGICDTNGVVTVKWKKGKENDIYGYRVFRAFYKNKEPVRISDTTIFDTVFVEKVNLKSGWRKIYYGIVAVDEVYNSSELSIYREVVLPDKIPPRNAVFTNYEATYSGILIEWRPSISEDIKYQYLYKKSEFEFQWTPLLKLSGKDLVRNKIRDTLTQTDVWYQYKLVAEDSAGLLSTEEQIIRVLQPQKDPFPVVTNLRAIGSRDNKMIKLSWDFNKQATGFKIMRSQEGKPVETYEFVSGTKREFYDKWLVTNTEYSYAIIAELPNGRKSIMSAIIKIKY
jgi:hypothetical protein